MPWRRWGEPEKHKRTSKPHPTSIKKTPTASLYWERDSSPNRPEIARVSKSHRRIDKYENSHSTQVVQGRRKQNGRRARSHRPRRNHSITITSVHEATADITNGDLVITSKPTSIQDEPKAIFSVRFEKNRFTENNTLDQQEQSVVNSTCSQHPSFNTVIDYKYAACLYT